jgi:rubrerythrin
MDSVEEFLAYAIRLERDAADRFGQLADAMAACGNAEVLARAGFRDMPVIATDDYTWPDIESPETAAIWAADPFIGRDQALEIALDAETAGLNYYRGVLDSTDNPETRILAREFVAEETAHVEELHKWIAAHKAGKTLPVDA